MFDGTNTNLNFRIAMRAAELIERDGLCKEVLHKRDQRGAVIGHCWLGAILDAEKELKVDHAERVIANSITLAEERGAHSPFNYNDAPETTAADVASLLRETARRCLVEGK